MPFAAALTRQQDAVFKTFGVAALWAGQIEPVLVILREEDREIDAGRSTIIAPAEVLRVRASDVAVPLRGDLISIVGGPVLKVAADPQRDRRNVWRCDVKEQV